MEEADVDPALRAAHLRRPAKTTDEQRDEEARRGGGGSGGRRPGSTAASDHERDDAEPDVDPLAEDVVVRVAGDVVPGHRPSTQRP